MAYHLDWLELLCPWCHGELDAGGSPDPEVDSVLQCRKCARTFPVIFGIPDLRTFADPYITVEGDHIKGRMLASRFDRAGFLDLVRTYYHMTPETPPRDVELNLTRLSNAEDRARGTVHAWDAMFGGVEGETMLEVGCGTAPLLLATRDRFTHQVGVDISFRWLVMAKRRLADAGVNIPLVAACGEALPFRDGAFAVTAMDSYLEITREQETAVDQAKRVLQRGGRLLVSTPNRFSLGPDPHVGVPAGGILPSGVVNAIARQRMARPPLRRLLSAKALAHVLTRVGTAEVLIPPLSEAQLRSVGTLGRVVGGWYNRLREAPVARETLRIVGPLLLGQARKP